MKEKLNLLNQQAENIDWNEREKSEKILREKSDVENTLNRFNELDDGLTCIEELTEIADDETLVELQQNLNEIDEKLEEFEIELLFAKPEDKMDCFLEINAGVGGDDACDFSNMLLNMYSRWAKFNGYKVEIIDIQDNIVAGITNAVIKVSGKYAFGKLKNESGVHRIVRISPYNANGKRETSFASVYVYPCIDETIKIDIDEMDLRIDTYRSSGAGGQHVNKTDSAVRITHLPTKIVVECQNERSQHQNKAEAMRVLKSKLYEIERQKLDEKTKNNNKTENGWGHQIRSYVMHPYQLVKDNRSGYEVSNFEKMMNGECLNDFIKSNLK